MKSWVVYVGLLAALSISCYCYQIKFSVPGKEDMLIASLAGMRPYLPPGSVIKLVNIVPREAPGATVDIFPAFISFIVPPAHISNAAVTAGDTLLVLLRADASPAAADSLVGGRTVLWCHADSLYKYMLIR